MSSPAWFKYMKLAQTCGHDLCDYPSLRRRRYARYRLSYIVEGLVYGGQQYNL